MPPAQPADRPTPDTPPRQPWRRRWRVNVISAVLLAVAVVAAVILVTVITGRRQHDANRPLIAPPASTAQPTSAAQPTGAQPLQLTYGPQVTLPFTGLSRPGGVAVDAAGDVYVADSATIGC